MQRTVTQTTPIQASPGPSDVRPYRERLLRIDDVCFMTGLGRSTIYAKIKAGDFPSAVQLHGTSVAWRETEVDAWIAARPAVGATPPVPPAQPAKPGRAALASAAGVL
ncbi:MAG: AlpA family phage regulatory protein [Acidovorax sp.]|nr:MAG: AlpA family phage regulatory protein [Acidovorax sp.]